ncbi:MAG: 2,3-bisphosphoglycerate-independent phosphoglycerate mutase [Alphaproteobacteria bacterium]|nr:MAG: 2,3-bisphosphoglycerate-independent phosphoglycerate mutase [Alphaproteobacteria bacterium]
MTVTALKPVKGPVVLCILDGFGYREEADMNAIKQARTPNYSRYWDEAPRAFVATSGLSVGLPDGQMGNSEVGHMNIGAGRVVMQDLPRIDADVASGALAENPALKDFAAALKASGGDCHLMGLLSPGGVHSHQDHMVALAKALQVHGIKVWVHAFLDGRDTPPKSAAEFVETFEKDLGEAGEIAVLTGRYFAMDRDKNWDRVEKAYRVMTAGKAAGQCFSDPHAAITACYGDDITDEFLTPQASENFPGMRDGDAILMANFRADRAREILTALLDPHFDGFAREPRINFAAALGMVEYSTALSEFVKALYPALDIHNTLGEWTAAKGKRQLRIAETEKYAHVTFFLNGGRETVFDKEERILIPSPKVATYDLQPEMSAPEVTDKLVDAITSGGFDLIVVNYANGDMVGHTGIMSAAIKAVETLDACLGRLETALKEAGGVMLVTADHGNVELMEDPETHGPHTAHTTFDVPLLLINAQALNTDIALKDGRLADLAPTTLQLMGLDIPQEMTGQSLLTPGTTATAAPRERMA